MVAELYVCGLILLYDVNAGFDPHNALVFTLDRASANLPKGADEDSLRALAGVDSLRVDSQCETVSANTGSA